MLYREPDNPCLSCIRCGLNCIGFSLPLTLPLPFPLPLSYSTHTSSAVGPPNRYPTSSRFSPPPSSLSSSYTSLSPSLSGYRWSCSQSQWHWCRCVCLVCAADNKPSSETFAHPSFWLTHLYTCILEATAREVKGLLPVKARGGGGYIQ